jgi:hypothetical protein
MEDNPERRGYRYDPEVELGAIGVVESAETAINQLPAAFVYADDIFHGIIESLDLDFDDSDATGQSFTVAALFNAKRSMSVVITIEQCQHQGQEVRGIDVQFYRGIPFGNIFEPRGGFMQFADRPVETAEGEVWHHPHPLTGVSALKFPASGIVEALSFSGRMPRLDPDIEPWDIENMRSWLMGADEPLEIIDGRLPGPD